MQEHAVIALLNLSLHQENKGVITNNGAIKSLVYVLKSGTETSKQKVEGVQFFNNIFDTVNMIYYYFISSIIEGFKIRNP